MLKTRLWMGAVLIALVICMLVFDQHIRRYPFQFVFQMTLAFAGCRELLGLLGKDRAPSAELSQLGVIGMTIGNWLMANVSSEISEAWTGVMAVATFMHLLIFAWSMRDFREGSQTFERMARTWWVIGYLGLLPSFFAQIRWLYEFGSPLGTTALALAIFVPKGCDIGAYFTGRLFGKHPMAPVLSPKKTWEGAVGGVVFAVLFTVGINRFGPAQVIVDSPALEVAFGITVGIAGMLGDLAESMIKRDCQQKDASHIVPGFGGVLDVVDSVIFAAPVAYLWFFLLRT